MMTRILAYLRQLLDPSNPSASLRHACYLAVVAGGIAWLTADMAIKTATGVHQGIDGNWNMAFATLCGLVGAGKILGGKNAQLDSNAPPSQ